MSLYFDNANCLFSMSASTSVRKLFFYTENFHLLSLTCLDRVIHVQKFQAADLYC